MTRKTVVAIIKGLTPEKRWMFNLNPIERKFAESVDIACEVIVYAKLPRGPKGFYIPTPVGNYSPDWAIAFRRGSVMKHKTFSVFICIIDKTEE
ncbi:hypothetical protein FACS189450_08460 [Spirochaetia bacterium]|nr:hypothetical protein FACS189450_08460 [Spirochaetia bacterium]